MDKLPFCGLSLIFFVIALVFWFVSWLLWSFGSLVHFRDYSSVLVLLIALSFGLFVIALVFWFDFLWLLWSFGSELHWYHIARCPLWSSLLVLWYIINIREPRAWLRGRYSHISSLIVDKVSGWFILSPFTKTLSDSETIFSQPRFNRLSFRRRVLCCSQIGS